MMAEWMILAVDGPYNVRTGHQSNALTTMRFVARLLVLCAWSRLLLSLVIFVMIMGRQACWINGA
jgi:hypothetical protein